MTRFDRACRRALEVGLIALATVIVFFWMARLGSDLTWDEALNFRAYARNPLTALAHYREANNHPLDSLIKSIFYSVFGLDERPGYRISGFLYVGAYLALGTFACVRLWKRGSILTATTLVLVMLLPAAVNHEAMNMRGYFLAMTLELGYCVLLARDARLFDAPGHGLPPPVPPWTGRIVFKYALLAALMSYSVLTTILAVPALTVLAVLALSPGAAPGKIVGRIVALGAASAALTALLYSPIFLAIALGLTGPQHFPRRELGGMLDALRDDLDCIATHLAPRGVPPWACALVLLAMIVVAIVLAARGNRLARLALTTAAVAVAVRLAFFAFKVIPRRTRPSLIVPLACAFVMTVHAAVSRWKPRAQTVGAMALVALSWCCVPAFVAEEHPDRRASGIASFIETYAGPREDRLLVVHNHSELLDYELRKVIGPEHVVEGREELDARLAGRSTKPRFEAGSWKRRLHDLVVGDEPVLPIDPAGLEVLVIIDHQDFGTPVSAWNHPTLEALKSRLSRHTEFSRDFHRIQVYEAP